MECCDEPNEDCNSNVYIGYNVDASAVDGANQIAIGNSFVSPGSNSFSFGKASNVVYNTFTNDANWTRSSDERLKTDIQDGKLGLDFINDLRTVSHKWKPSYEVPIELSRLYTEENQ